MASKVRSLGPGRLGGNRMAWFIIGTAIWFAIIYLIKLFDKLGLIELDENDPYEEDNVVQIEDFR